MIFAISKSTDCYFNLALEEHFLKSRTDDVFMLWQNDNTIVVGKNQNTLSEIDIDFVKKNDIRVVRRITGGGAVYHDMGNINFTYITNASDEWECDFSRFAVPVIRALQALGISARMSGRNDIVADGRKISGNAQTVVNGRLLHHGTLLFKADMSVLKKALKPDPTKIQSKGIKSVESRVANIGDMLGREIVATELMALIGAQVKELYKASDYEISHDDIASANKLADEKYRTWEWNFGYSPKYTFSKKKRFDCGNVEACLKVEDGIIKDATFYGDFFSVVDTKQIADALCGVLHRYEDVERVLCQFKLNDFFGKLALSELLEILI